MINEIQISHDLYRTIIGIIVNLTFNNLIIILHYQTIIVSIYHYINLSVYHYIIIFLPVVEQYLSSTINDYEYQPHVLSSYLIHHVSQTKVLPPYVDEDDIPRW